MSKMRLTTLNLDQECLDLLGAQPNKSAYVRNIIKNYAKLEAELSHIEDLLINNRIWYATLRQALIEGYERESIVGEVIASLCDETRLQISKYAQTGHLDQVIRSGVARRANP